MEGVEKSDFGPLPPSAKGKLAFACKLVDAKESKFDKSVDANGDNKPFADNGDSDKPVSGDSVH